MNGTSFNSHAHLRYREWQFGVGISQRIDAFVPYAAVKYSNVHGTLSQINSSLGIPHNSFKMRSRCYWGLVLGCTLTACELFDMTVEARMIDEQAITLAGNIKI